MQQQQTRDQWHTEENAAEAAGQPAGKKQRLYPNSIAGTAEATSSAVQPASPKLKAWIPVDLLVGLMVEVRRSNGTWSAGYINGVHKGGPQPHLVIRFVNKDWKRVLLTEVEANIRPHAGEAILESMLEPCPSF